MGLRSGYVCTTALQRGAAPAPLVQALLSTMTQVGWLQLGLVARCCIICLDGRVGFLLGCKMLVGCPSCRPCTSPPQAPPPAPPAEPRHTDRGRGLCDADGAHGR